MSDQTRIDKPHMNPDDDPYEPQGYNCHWCHEWVHEDDVKYYLNRPFCETCYERIEKNEPDED